MLTVSAWRMWSRWGGHKQTYWSPSLMSTFSSCALTVGNVTITSIFSPVCSTGCNNNIAIKYPPYPSFELS
jgi:hypothetical protein